MNIDKVYICDIYRLEDKKYNKFDFVKQALVCYSVLQGGFFDMETGQFYKLGFPCHVGELFVDVNKSKIYGKDLMGTKKKQYTKKRILNRYNQYKEGKLNECK